jgi:hypothetical protein
MKEKPSPQRKAVQNATESEIEKATPKRKVIPCPEGRIEAFPWANDPMRGKLQFYSNEKWQELTIEGKHYFRYAISNFGRVVSYTENVRDGKLVKPIWKVMHKGHKTGFWLLNLKTKVLNEKGEYVTKAYRKYIHKLVAEFFVSNEDPQNNTFVKHINEDRDNNTYLNLKWVPRREILSPEFLEGASPGKIVKGPKLTIETATLLKKKIFEGKTRQRILAKQFGVSEMAITRMKRGENWGSIQIDIPLQAPKGRKKKKNDD